MFFARIFVLFIFNAGLFVAAQTSKSPIGLIESLIRSQQYDQALQSSKSALLETPNDYRIWTLQGIVLSLKGNSQDALSSFEKALSYSPSYIAALKGEAQLLYQTQDKRAIPVLEKIVRASPKDETAHEMLATLEQKLGQCGSAIDHFVVSEAVIATHPASLEAYGYCLAQTKQYQKAISVFEQLVALLPERTYPKYDLAVLLIEAKQHETALKVLEPLLAADRPDPELLSLASDAYEAVGDTPHAVSFLRQAIVLSPSDASYYNTFAAICLDHDSFQVGIDMINAGLKRMPNDSSLYISRGLLYAQLADYDKAEADFNTAERLDPGQSLSAYAMDIADLQKNLNISDKDHPENALLEIRSQLKAHPDSPYLNFLLATLLINQGAGVDVNTSDEAFKAALLAVKMKPDLVKARDILASMYITSGQYNLAIVQCRSALQYSPSDKTAIYHLIVALRHSAEVGQREEIPLLVKRLSDLQQTALRQETDRKRFKLVEQEPTPMK